METSIDLDRAALLLVDLQRDLLHEDGALRRGRLPSLDPEEVQVLVQTCQDLIAKMRAAGRPIVWVKTELRSDYADSAMAPAWLERRRAAVGTFLTQGSWGAELMDGCGACPGTSRQAVQLS